jgi:hypothetical protein
VPATARLRSSLFVFVVLFTLFVLGALGKRVPYSMLPATFRSRCAAVPRMRGRPAWRLAAPPSPARALKYRRAMVARSIASCRTPRVRVAIAVTATVVLVASGSASADSAAPAQPRAQLGAVPAEPVQRAVPRAVCGPNARPETGIQGRISRADHVSGLAAKGLQCNAELVGEHTQEKAGVDGTIVGTVGGYMVLRYKDKQGNECAYYDTSLLPPTNAGDGNVGVRVLDMNDPKHPKLTMTLTSAAMVSPHESLVLSEKRGLLMAVAGNSPRPCFRGSSTSTTSRVSSGAPSRS